MALLDASDIPAAPVKDLADVFSDPQVQARGLVRSYEHPVVGTVRFPGSPMQFADLELPDAPAPMLGQHTAEVLAERLGYDAKAIDELVRDGLVAVWPGRG